MAFVHISAIQRAAPSRTSARSRPSTTPPEDIDGLLAWAAGSNDNGLNVVSVWQSGRIRNVGLPSSSSRCSRRSDWLTVPANSEFTEYETGELYLR